MVRHDVKIDFSELWKKLPWKKFRRQLFRLQVRLFKATAVKNFRKAKSIQKLILKSRAARFLAIRQVTQLNQGKKTAGIDGKKGLNFNERFDLEKRLQTHANNWVHQGLREIPIPKKDGSTRILKVPTIADRAWQCLAKFVLEPAHEATFSANSYGFRTGRSAHDAQDHIFILMSGNSIGASNKKIIELDIEKCFDRISHKAIMDNLIAPKGVKQGIFRCLKSGTNPSFPDQGTPQGGVVSPLFANIALNGIEEIAEYNKNVRKGKRDKITPKTPKDKIAKPSVRYADDVRHLTRC